MAYVLYFQNNSTQIGSACVYQSPPDTSNPNIMSLAWFSQMAAPTSTLQFGWDIDYSFTWSQTGLLAPGVLFSATQSWPADLSLANQVQFSVISGAYTFQNQTQGPLAGNLYIMQDSTIPPNQASVGIGMGGSGTFALQGQPNMQAVFSPTPQYWITFGNYIQGEVLDITNISNPAAVAFPPNVFSMTAILNADNTWTVQETSQVNNSFVEARKTDAKARWGAKAA